MGSIITFLFVLANLLVCIIGFFAAGIPGLLVGVAFFLCSFCAVVIYYLAQITHYLRLDHEKKDAQKE